MYERLDGHLQAWARRLGWRRGAIRASRVVLWSTLVVCAATAVACWVPLPPSFTGDARGWLILLGGAGLLTALLPFFTTRFRRHEAAMVADMRLDTQALFTTAEDALRRHEQGQNLSDAEQACLQRATERAQSATAAQIAPLNPGPGALALIAPLLVAAAIVWAPLAVDVAGIQEEENLAAAAKTLEELSKRPPETPEDAAAAELRRKMRRLTRRMQKGELSATEAMEEVSAIKRELRAEKMRRAERASTASRAAAGAGRELGRSKETSNLGRKLAQGARAKDAQSDAAKEAREEASKALRELDKLSRDQKAAAAESLRKAAQAAQAAGDSQMAEALENAAKALENNDSQALQQAGQQLQDALQQAQQQGESQSGLQEMAQGLDQAQQQLAQGGQQFQEGNQRTINGNDSGISPSPRNWRQGNGNPSQNGQGTASGAGDGHDPEEAPGFDIDKAHQDANRFDDTVPEDKEIDYQELYEAFLLNSGDRVGTRVRGQMGDTGDVQTVKGGQQSPRQEDARRMLKKLPVQYAKEVDDAVNDESIPPVYRDAVKDYFEQ